MALSGFKRIRRSGFAAVSTYATGIQYRASGALKHLTAGSGVNISLSYNERLQVTSYSLQGAVSGGTGDPWSIGSNYEYNSDGKLRFANNLDNKFDRLYQYDQVGRMTEASSGSEANGGIGELGPYRQSYQYDVWDNVIMHSNRFWSFTPLPTTATYVNDRNPAWQYDAAGNVVHAVENFTNISDSTYDAAGEMINSSQTSDGRTATISQTYDGDRQPAKRIEQRPSHTSTIYYVRSSLLGGQVVTELNAQGQKTRGYVYASGQVLAIQNVTANGSSVYWRHIEPVTENFVEINQNRAVLTVFDTDPVGAFLGTSDPFEAGASPSYDELIGDRPSHDIDADPFDTSSGCTLDGIPINCNLVMQMVNNGGAVTAPLKSVAPVYNRDKRVYTGFVFDYGLGSEGGWVLTPLLILNAGRWRSGGEDIRLGVTYVQPRWVYVGGPWISGQSGSGQTGLPTSNLPLNRTLGLIPPTALPQDRLMTPQEVFASDAITKAAQLLAQGPCGSYIARLIQAASEVPQDPAFALSPRFELPPHPTYALNQYRRALSEGRVTPSWASGAEGGGMTYGETTLRWDNGLLTVKTIWNNEFYGLDSLAAGQHTIHESLHHVPNFSDVVLANTAGRFARSRRSFTDRTPAARYLNEQIADHCH